MILTAIGFVYVLDWVKSKGRKVSLGKIVVVIYLILIAASLENYLNIYFKNYRNEYSWSWQYGYEQVVDYVKINYDDYDKVIISKKFGEPHEYFLFFWPWDPGKYQNDPNLIRFYQSNWYWVDRFDKFYFVNDWEIVSVSGESKRSNYEFVLESGGIVHCTPNTEHCLLITSPGNVPGGWSKLETIKFLDGNPAFEIYEN
jgi:hypothetical protein